MPGLVSTLLNQAYSMPGRLVQTCLQVTEQVWQPMHLSRFRTMPICARTFMLPPDEPSLGWPPPLGAANECERGGSCCFSHVFGFLVEPVDPVHLAHHHELVAVGADRSVVVEAVAELGVAADHVGGLEHDASHRVVDAAAHAGDLGAGRVDDFFLG